MEPLPPHSDNREETSSSGQRLVQALRKGRQLPPLSLGVRILVLVVGWSFILLGVAGLFLPILQGVLFLFVGGALVSVASNTVHRWLRGRFGGWPRGWRRLERLRRRLHAMLHRGQ